MTQKPAWDRSVSLSLEPGEDPVVVGQTFEVALTATKDLEGEAQPVSALTAVVVWDPKVLRLVGADNNGPFSWMLAGFLRDPDRINVSLDDGDAVYTALAPPGAPAKISKAGLLVTTFKFEALLPCASSLIDIALKLGRFGRTQVFDGTVENLDVLGSTKAAIVEVKNAMEPDFDFGEALKRLRDKKLVSRKGWNGPNQRLRLQVPDVSSKMTLPYIYIKTVQGDLIPWLASQTDMLAEDWFEVFS